MTTTVKFELSFDVPTLVERLPETEPRKGDVYEFTRTIFTFAKVEYKPGDRLFILARTEEAPFGFKDPQGNFVVRCKYFTSVWSSIRYGINLGWLRLVTRPGEES